MCAEIRRSHNILHEPSSKRIPTISTHSRVDHYKISSIWQINRERLPLIDDFIQLNVCFTHLRYLIGLMKMMMRNAIINGQWWHHFFLVALAHSTFFCFHSVPIKRQSKKKQRNKKRYKKYNKLKNLLCTFNSMFNLDFRHLMNVVRAYGIEEIVGIVRS